MALIDQFRQIVWDFNGTLIDDLDAAFDIQQQMLRLHGLAPLTKARYLDTFDFPIRDWYAFLGYDTEQYDQLAQQWAALYQQRAAHLGLCPGAQALLDLFAQRGIRQSVLSAANVQQLNMLLRALGIDGYFDPVLGLDNSRAHGKIALCSALRASSPVPPEQMLFIGDTTQDVLTARALGSSCVLVACGHQSRTRLEQTGVPVYENHAALRAALLEKNG